MWNANLEDPNTQQKDPVMEKVVHYGLHPYCVSYTGEDCSFHCTSVVFYTLHWALAVCEIIHTCNNLTFLGIE